MMLEDPECKYLREPFFEEIYQILKDFPSDFRNNLLIRNIRYWQQKLKELGEDLKIVVQKIAILPLEQQRLLEAVILKIYEKRYNFIVKRLNYLYRLKNALNKKNYLSVEEIKKTPIADVAIQLNLHLKPLGSNKFVSLCPFHKEKHPSLVLYTNTNRFYCFGCHKKGDVIDLVMEVKKCSFKEALIFLKEAGHEVN